MDKTEELLLRIVNGDKDAEGELLVMYSSLALMIAQSYASASPIMEADDIFQLGMIGLLSAARTYKASEGASFRTYAAHCVHNSIRDGLKAKKAPVTVELAEAEDVKTTSEPEAAVIESEDAELLLERIYSVLTDAERTVLSLYMENRSYLDIAKTLGMDRKKVDNTVYSLKKKIKKLLKWEG